MHRDERVPDNLPMVVWRRRRDVAWWPGLLAGLIVVLGGGLATNYLPPALSLDIPDITLYLLAVPIGVLFVVVTSVSHARIDRLDASRHGPVIGADTGGLWFRVLDPRTSAVVRLAWHEVLDIGVTTIAVPDEPDRTEACLYVRPVDSALEFLVDPELEDHVRDTMYLHRVPFVLREKELPDTAERVVNHLRQLASGPGQVGPAADWRPADE